eukprot:2098205-Amphidinium_carterae.1
MQWSWQVPPGVHTDFGVQFWYCQGSHVLLQAEHAHGTIGTTYSWLDVVLSVVCTSRGVQLAAWLHP